MSRWRRPLVLLAAMLAVAVAVAANQVLSGGVWSWPWIPVSLALAVAGAAVTERLTKSAIPTPLRLSDRRGRPPLLGEVSPEDLGVHPTRFGRRGASPYLARTVDDELERALADGDRRIVVLHGQKLAGTTRCLWHAATTVLAGHRVLVYRPDPRQRLADLIDDARRWAAGPGAVLWLDEITSSQLAELDHDLVERLPAGLRLCLPCDTAQVTGHHVPHHLSRVLREDAAVVELDVLSADERARLRDEPAYRELVPAIDAGAPLLLGRLLVTLDELERLLRPTGEDGVDRVALLRVVTDWQRAGVPARLGRRTLAELHHRYGRDLAGAEVSPSGFGRALKAARHHRPPLVERVRVAGSTHHVPHPLLAAVADDPDSPAGWPVSGRLWEYAEHALTEDERHHLALVALDRADIGHAYALLCTVPVAELNVASVFGIARWLDETKDDVVAARRWYALAAEAGDPEVTPNALHDLGVLEYLRGNLDQARHWYRRTVDFGERETTARALHALGLIARDRGDLGEATRWLRLAADTGHPRFAPMAMLVLGEFAIAGDDRDQARDWLRTAVDRDEPDTSPRAMDLLGRLEHQDGNPGRARELLQRAAESGHPTAAPSSMRWLGELELAAGHPARARRWFLRAVDSGDPDAGPRSMYFLASLAHEEDEDTALARDWYQRAIDAGHADASPVALYALGRMETELGNFVAARHCHQLAVATGYPTIVAAAKHGLGVVAEYLGEVAEARRWYLEAIDSGAAEPVARGLLNLAGLEGRLGDTGQAHQLYLAAIETGYPPVVDDARRLLAALERRLTDAEEATRFVERGSWRFRHDG